MKERRKVVAQVTIEYEVDTEHHDLAWMSPDYADAVAKDLAIRPSKSIESGVQLISVGCPERDEWWLIKNDER